MKKILTIVLLFAFTQTHAALIDQGTYFSDTDSGLDWLKLAPTLGRSYNDVSSKLGAGQEFDGWRYATGNEFEQLLLNDGFLPDNDIPDIYWSSTPCAPGINFCYNWNRGADTTSLAQMVSMSDLFGNLAPLVPAYLGCVATTTGIILDVDSGNINPTANFTAKIEWCAPIQGGIETYSSSQAPNDTNGGVASYLVSTGAVVPVPAAVWLFGSALGLLGWVRRKTA